MIVKRAIHGDIEIRGARENNLKNVSLDLPKRKITVFTGVSGSGKSSLVFATIAAESQRLINEWSQLLTSEDYRGLTPLTWAHVAMHGEFKLNMNSRLDLGHTSP